MLENLKRVIQTSDSGEEEEHIKDVLPIHTGNLNIFFWNLDI